MVTVQNRVGLKAVADSEIKPKQNTETA